MDFKFFKPQNWRKRSGEARRHNCAVLPTKQGSTPLRMDAIHTQFPFEPLSPRGTGTAHVERMRCYEKTIACDGAFALTALTATVSAEGATDFSYFNYYDVDAKNQITFKFHAEYTCRAYEKWGDADIVTEMPSNLYMAQSLESWTSDQIVFKIGVNKVYCKGREDGGDRHGAHTNLVTEPTKTVTFEGSDLCHKPLTNLTATIGGVLYREMTRLHLR